MKKTKLLILSSLLLIVGCNQINSSEIKDPDDDYSSSENTPDNGKNENVALDSFLQSASKSYSIRATVDEYTNYNGLTTTAKNYMDVASKTDYFSITKYNQVFDGMGTINRNVINSDSCYKSYEYEGENVVSSSYLNLANEISYDVHKDIYGQTTLWDKSFKSFFSNLGASDFITEDNITYSLNLETASSELCDEILYQLGCLAVSSTTSYHVENVSLKFENEAFSKVSFVFIDNEDESLYSSLSIEGDITTGTKAENAVKVENEVTGNDIEELDTALNKLKNYNFDYSLKVTISTNIFDEYTTTAQSDGSKIISDKFSYIESQEGLDYYLAMNDGNQYKTMNTIKNGKLNTLLPSFNISSKFFVKAAKNTYILSNNAKRCTASLKELSVYIPFSISFSNLTIKLGDDSISFKGINGAYQFDFEYTNIGKVSTLEFEDKASYGYGNHLYNYAWSYEDFIAYFQTQLGLESVDETYEVMNNIPTYYSYIIDSAPYFTAYQTLLGIRYTYGNSQKRDNDFTNIISFYTANGFNLTSLSSENDSATVYKTITINEEQKKLTLHVLTGKYYEIPMIGIFPVIS